MPADDLALSRLRWQCRRGLLENDLILDRFLARYGRELEGAQLAAFKNLLELGDNELWDILSGRVDPLCEEHHVDWVVVRMLRNC